MNEYIKDALIYAGICVLCILALKSRVYFVLFRLKGSVQRLFRISDDTNEKLSKVIGYIITLPIILYCAGMAGLLLYGQFTKKSKPQVTFKERLAQEAKRKSSSRLENCKLACSRVFDVVFKNESRSKIIYPSEKSLNLISEVIKDIGQSLKAEDFKPPKPINSNTSYVAVSNLSDNPNVVNMKRYFYLLPEQNAVAYSDGSYKNMKYVYISDENSQKLVKLIQQVLDDKRDSDIRILKNLYAKISKMEKIPDAKERKNMLSDMIPDKGKKRQKISVYESGSNLATLNEITLRTNGEVIYSDNYNYLKTY